jgi:hypothetical protein
MIKGILGVLLILVPPAQSTDLWKAFEAVKFESKYIEAEKASFYVPQFNDTLLGMDGKRFTIKGYYLPIDMSSEGIVLSRFPMATCFFCGEAGPESVIMVYPNKKLEGLKMDEQVSFEGVLKLNKSDVYQLTFVLQDAKRL